MKTNLRYFYSCFASVVGVFSIKQAYFHKFKRKELDLVKSDFAVLGGLSGLFVSWIIFGLVPSILLKSILLGCAYWMIYYYMIKYSINKKRNAALKLGIKL